RRDLASRDRRGCRKRRAGDGRAARRRADSPHVDACGSETEVPVLYARRRRGAVDREVHRRSDQEDGGLLAGAGEGMKYVLITPARNEAAFITKTLESVCSQTLRPEKWVVVDDGSTDRTAEIVSQYA